jgi:hypothetical protein
MMMMKFQLLVPHVIADEYLPAGTVMGLPGGKPIPANYIPTPHVKPLDSEAEDVVRIITRQVYGRYPNTPYNLDPREPLLDDPPIVTSLDANQPVGKIPGMR